MPRAIPIRPRLAVAGKCSLGKPRALKGLKGKGRADRSSGPSPYPYSPSLEGVFSEVRLNGVLRTSHRGCMKSGSWRVFRYSSTHEKVLPDGFIRCRMELHRASFARPHRIWTAQDPQSPRDPERHLLPPKERLPVAPTAA